MAKPLRSQLNQIRAWVQQGRTDAWIAHQLEVSASELQEFRRRHELTDEPSTDEVDLRDEIEAEIQAAMDAEPEEDEEEPEEADGADADEEAEDEEPADEPSADAEPADAESGEDQPKRRRRRRGGRGRGRAKAGLQATLQHGEPDGYGLWLDPAIVDNPVYAEHWAGQKEVEVDVQPDQIVVKRAG